jgi:H+-translocating NAD(P) transhydrogenase
MYRLLGGGGGLAAAATGSCKNASLSSSSSSSTTARLLYYQSFLLRRRRSLHGSRSRWEKKATTDPKTAAAAAAAATTPKGIPYGNLTIGIPKETFALEKRVAATPESIQRLLKPANDKVTGFKAVQVETGAGIGSKFTDVDYEKAGATIVDSASAVWKNSDIVLKLRPPTLDEVQWLENRIIISMLWPAQNPDLIRQLQEQQATALAMDCIPRTLSRGQTYDALSSQANIAGYRAVLEASAEFGRFFAGQMTAAGKVPPAQVLVIGTGVAGLAAIQTAKNMGAAVSAFDVRPVTKEQVQAMGAKFLEVDYQEDGSADGGYAKEMSKEWHAAARSMLTKQCAMADIVITTALIPGRTAPIMVTKEMVLQHMKNGSVTVDLAAEAGGNIETTVRDQKIVTPNGVTCLGYTDLPSRLSTTASTLYANNISKFLLSAGPQTTKQPGYFYMDHADEAVRGMLVVEKGKLMWPAPPVAQPAAAPTKKKEEEASKVPTVVDHRAPYLQGAKTVGMMSAAILGAGAVAPNPVRLYLCSYFFWFLSI